jgi:hypothetical protein
MWSVLHPFFHASSSLPLPAREKWTEGGLKPHQNSITGTPFHVSSVQISMQIGDRQPGSAHASDVMCAFSRFLNGMRGTTRSGKLLRCWPSPSPDFSRKGPRWRRFASDTHEIWNLGPISRTTGPDQPPLRLTRIDYLGDNQHEAGSPNLAVNRQPVSASCKPVNFRRPVLHQAPHNIESRRPAR